MKATILKTTDGTEVLSISNNGFHPILLLEYIASSNGWLPIQVVTGEDNFLISFPTDEILRAARDYINANY
jgi:hypothetical protein